MQLRVHHAAWLALGTALISGVSNFVNKYSVTVIKDPIAFTLLKNAIVAVLVLSAVMLFTRLRELRSIRKADVFKLLAIGIIGGGIPFALFFTGLTMTSAVTASLIHKTLFLWVAILAVPLLKERIGRIQAAALILLVAGNLMLGGWQQLSFGKGELLIFCATLLWAVENVIAKKALRNLSSSLVAGARMGIGSLVLLAIVAFQGNIQVLGGLTAVQWGWTLLPAALLTGYVLTWYTALKHAPATLVASLLVPATFLTTLLSRVFQGKPIAQLDLASGILVTGAVTLLLWASWRSVRVQQSADAYGSL